MQGRLRRDSGQKGLKLTTSQGRLEQSQKPNVRFAGQVSVSPSVRQSCASALSPMAPPPMCKNLSPSSRGPRLRFTRPSQSGLQAWTRFGPNAPSSKQASKHARERNERQVIASTGCNSQSMIGYRNYNRACTAHRRRLLLQCMLYFRRR